MTLTDKSQAQKAPSPKSGRIIQLDFVRGIAILVVMQYHFLALPISNPVLRGLETAFRRTGWMGVDLFFVLSGFLVGGLLLDEFARTEDLRVGRFLLRRMFKIWPTYYVYILFQVIVTRHTLGSFFWQNTLNIQNYVGTSLKHTWSLAVEEHFYLLLPLLLTLAHKRQGIWKRMVQYMLLFNLVILIGRVVAVYGFHVSGVRVQWETQTRVDSLIAGVMLGYLMRFRPEVFTWMQNRKIALAAIALVGPICALWLADDSPLMWSFGYTVNWISGCALLMLMYGYHGWAIRTRLYRLIANIGLYSYGIYLWHVSVRFPIAHFVTRLPAAIQGVTLEVGQVVCAIALGTLVSKLVEFPMLRLRERLIPARRKQQPAIAPVVVEPVLETARSMAEASAAVEPLSTSASGAV